ncbi:LysR substrate-binding domain-containing protein [Paraburkholderia azotifigens]
MANLTCVTLNVRYEVNSLSILVGVAQGKVASSILPFSSCLDAVRSGALDVRPIAEPGITRVQSIVWPEHHPLSPAAAAVRDILRKTIHGLLENGTVRGRLL